MAFVDTSFLYAIADRRDSFHTEATELLREMGREHESLTITSLVLGEAWTLTGHRLGHRAAVNLVGMVRQSSAYEVLHVSEEAADGAFEWLAGRPEREFSFVDATSFQVMWDRRIDTALSFDADFDAVGFVTLRA